MSEKKSTEKQDNKKTIEQLRSIAETMVSPEKETLLNAANLLESVSWIPVEVRLPDCENDYGVSQIVWGLDAHGRTGFAIYQNGTGRLRHEGWFTGGGLGEDSVKITHWMPIPR